MQRAVFCVSLPLLLAACAHSPGGPPPTTLAGTAWRLHAIRSMDDAHGTTPVPESKIITVHFDADGRAKLRLDCNRGSGSWESTAAGDGTGTLRFGPIAATRALCPPPSVDERVVRELDHVRGYRLQEGKLFMSLMADGGILEWHPHRE